MTIYDIIQRTTIEFRKGPRITREQKPWGEKIEIWNMPHVDDAPTHLVKVDVHFMVVGVNPDAAEMCRTEFLKWCRAYPQPEHLAGGPSYIELGGVVGNQGRALRLMALGKVLGLWEVITPKTVGIEGPDADDLAGRGFVMMSGFKDLPHHRPTVPEVPDGVTASEIEDEGRHG